ncbi:MAG: hypothetical protein JNK47_14125 [Mesorhizobium sp.]|nr:hypothetical protein [Mesorhizobium sp.]MBL8578357.1 hypothetical protein [Mesorhizobium sp.]
MVTYYVVSNRAPSPQQRGVTYDAAMRYLDVMARDDLSLQEIGAAYDSLYADSAPAANARVITMGARPDDHRTHITTIGGKRVPMATIERLLAMRPRVPRVRASAAADQHGFTNRLPAAAGSVVGGAFKLDRRAR